MQQYLAVGEVLSPLLFVSSSYGAKTKVDNVISHYALEYALSDMENPLGYLWSEKKVDELYTERNFGYRCTAARFLKIERRIKTYTSRPGLYIDWPTYPRTPSGKKRNLPAQGRNEQILPGSKFQFLVFARENKIFPKITTLGKKRAYIKLEFQELQKIKEESGEFDTEILLYYPELKDFVEPIKTSIHNAGHHLYMSGKFKGDYVVLKNGAMILRVPRYLYQLEKTIK